MSRFFWLRLKLYGAVYTNPACSLFTNMKLCLIFERSIWSIYQFCTWSSLTEEYVNDDLMSDRDSHIDLKFDSLAVFRWFLLKTCVVSRLLCPIEAQVDDAPGKTKFFDESLSSLIVVKATVFSIRNNTIKIKWTLNSGGMSSTRWKQRKIFNCGQKFA